MCRRCKPAEAAAELKRCAVDLGFPGVVIASELQGRRSTRRAASVLARGRRSRSVCLHPSAAAGHRAGRTWMPTIWGACSGWEFSLMVAAVRVINSGLLDELPTLQIQFAHLAGGIGRYLGRIRGFQQRDKWGTAAMPRHGRQPKLPFDHYLEHRLYYDCAGWAGPDHAAEWGAEWVRFGLQEVALSQTVFATDYPQAVRDADEVAGYVAAVRALGPNARAMVDGVAAERADSRFVAAPASAATAAREAEATWRDRFHRPRQHGPADGPESDQGRAPGLRLRRNAAAARQVRRGGRNCGALARRGLHGGRLVITMLPAREQVREVYLGQGGVLASAAAGTLLDRLLDRRRRDRARRGGAPPMVNELDDARCAGVRRRRRRAGGDADLHGRRRRRPFERAKPVLEAMGKTIMQAGAAGSGQAAKICNNMILGDFDDRGLRGVRAGREARARCAEAVRDRLAIVRPMLVADELLPGARPGADLAGQPRLSGRASPPR